MIRKFMITRTIKEIVNKTNNELNGRGLHENIFALMQNNSADKLDIKMAFANHALGSFADNCESFRQNIV